MRKAKVCVVADDPPRIRTRLVDTHVRAHVHNLVHAHTHAHTPLLCPQAATYKESLAAAHAAVAGFVVGGLKINRPTFLLLRQYF